MIQEGYLYVDKTYYIYSLFSSGQRNFFLSRPRRFGKSLLISTLKALFQGKKELFKDLWIGKQASFEWRKHSVIHLDFSNTDNETPQDLKISLSWMLDEIAQEYGLELPPQYSPKAKLRFLVKKLHSKNPVVVLIDEYDKPILDHIHNSKKANEQRETLKNFYDGFKGLDAYLRAIFITGVSKFSKTSIFSGLNNLDELSNEPAGAELVGYTQTEVIDYFSEYISEIARQEQQSFEQTLEKIGFWYDGYQFSKKPVKMYNPFSIIKLFSKKSFQNYWFESGTPDIFNRDSQEKTA